jgi:hypothetical protein
LRIFKTKEFSRYTRREGVNNNQLCEAVRRTETGLRDADLGGGGLIKQRIARTGRGRRGGYRFLMAFRVTRRTVFLYGFAKSERENIQPDELNFWRSVAVAFIGMDETKIKIMLNEGEISEVDCGEEN